MRRPTYEVRMSHPEREWPAQNFSKSFRKRAIASRNDVQMCAVVKASSPSLDWIFTFAEASGDPGLYDNHHYLCTLLGFIVVYEEGVDCVKTICSQLR